MWIADKWKEYEVIDCSKGEKLERWGKYLLIRPDPRSSGTLPELTPDGSSQTPIITAAKKAAENGNFSTCQSNGICIIKI